MDRKYNVLCLDGGGVGGVLTAKSVCMIEKELQTKLAKELKKKTGLKETSLLAQLKAASNKDEWDNKWTDEQKFADDCRIHYFFDLFAGTSAGGLLTVAYLLPNDTSSKRKLDDTIPNQETHFETTEEVLVKYQELMKKAFVKRWLEKALLELFPEIPSQWSKIILLVFYNSFYEDEKVKEALEKSGLDLRSKKLSQLMGPCVIVAHDTSRAGEKGRWRFCQHRSALEKNGELKDCKVKGCKLEDGKLKDCKLEACKLKNCKLSGEDFWLDHVCRATSSAPAYFPPIEAESLEPEKEFHRFVDGGVYANNPSLMAYKEIRDLDDENGNPENMNVLSIGTGSYVPYQTEGDARKRLLLQLRWWFSLLIHNQMSNAHTVMRSIFRDYWRKGHYFRLDVTFDDPKLDEIDNANPKHLERLIKIAEDKMCCMKEKRKKLLDNCLNKIVEEKVARIEDRVAGRDIENPIYTSLNKKLLDCALPKGKTDN